MSIWAKKRKCDLKELAIEFGAVIKDSDNIAKIIKKLTELEDFDEDLALAQLEIIENDRLAREEDEKAERDRIKSQEWEEKNKEAEREHELAKLKLKYESDNVSIASSEVERQPKILLKSVLPKFDAEKSEISIYLSLFERQAQKAQIEKKQWVTHLLGLLPTELGEIILREATEDSDDFEYIKKVLLERFKLSAEDFRLKFVTTFKPENKTWKDFAYDISNYFDQWLSGLEVTSFDQLRNLIIADQLKRKVTPEIKDHFIDVWSSMITPFDLANKLDAYEAARKSIKREGSSRTLNNIKSTDRNKSMGNSKFEPKTDEMIPNWREKDNSENRDEVFDKRREITCLFCFRKGHIKYNCPEKRKTEQIERVNFMSDMNYMEEASEPFISSGIINGKEIKLIRDSGSNLDLISAHDVNTDQYTGERVLIKHALGNELHCLPIVNIKLQLATGQIVKTRAAAVDKETDMCYYLLGNRTQQLIDRQKTEPHLNNNVFTKKRASWKTETQSEINQTSCGRKRNNFSPSKNETLTGFRKGKIFDPPLERRKRIFSFVDNSSPGVSLVKNNRDRLSTLQKQDITLDFISKRAVENKSFFERKNRFVSKIKGHNEMEREKNVVQTNFRKRGFSLPYDNLRNRTEFQKSESKIFSNYFRDNAVNDREKEVLYPYTIKHNPGKNRARVRTV